MAAVEVAGPGFLNITVDAGAQGQVAAEIVAAGASYGGSEVLAGQRVNVEFISANPTGPLHLGHTRWAVLGDAIARVLQAAGAEVTREFYINDRGNQMDLFGASIEAAALGQADPRGRLPGRLHPRPRRPDRRRPAGDPRPARRRAPGRLPGGGVRRPAQGAAGRSSTASTPTSTCGSPSGRLHEDTSHGSVTDTLKGLEDKGTSSRPTAPCGCAPRTSATTRTGCSSAATASLTYFASDTAYYLNKRARGFDRCIYLLGADHHGYVGRLRAMAACAGDDPDAHIEVLIGQMVKILRDGAELRLSKRAGTIVTLDELVEEIGVDALRYSWPATPPTARSRSTSPRSPRPPATTPSTTCSTPTPAPAG